MKPFALPAALFVACLSLSACMATGPTTPSVRYVQEKTTSRLVSTTAPRYETLPSGQLRAWAELSNLSADRVVMQVRAAFLSEGGQEVEKPTAWKQVFIEQGSSAQVEFLSMSTRALHARIEVKEGQR